MRRFALAVLVVLVPAPAAAAAPGDLQGKLARGLSAAGPASGAHVVDLTSDRVIFSVRAGTPRVMMSNTKLFTTAAALEALGPRRRFRTVALGSAPVGADGVLDGDLALRGGGDPTFDDAAAGRLVAALRQAGLTRVRGAVIGDGSLFDTELGPPLWFLNDSPPGPVDGLQFNRGIVETTPSGQPSFAEDPAAFAAEGVRRALIAGGIAVDGGADAGATPPGAVRLAAVQSPPLSRLVRRINKPSDNLFAETLAKHLGLATFGEGSRAAGVRAALRFARRLGVRARIRTGSGAFPFPRAAPRQLVKLLVRLRALRTFDLLRKSLPIAGRDGTLAERMRGGPAQGRCRAKTGTHFSDVTREQASVLSGYCRARNDHLIAFSIMMNRIPDVEAARRLQDRMVEAIAATRRSARAPGSARAAP